MRLTVLSIAVCTFTFPGLTQTVELDSPASVKLKDAKAEAVTFKGRKAIRLTGTPQADGLAVLSGIAFGDGTIEVDMAGEPGAGAAEAARGFVGIAFRTSENLDTYECFYLRPTNGRAEDQVRRNHSVQYTSHPEFPWPRLRKEFPEKYESYVDLQPGEWTKVRIVAKGTSARLYVHGAEQPTLIVDDLKRGVRQGGVALWIGPGTLGHFTNIRVSK